MKPPRLLQLLAALGLLASAGCAGTSGRSTEVAVTTAAAATAPDSAYVFGWGELPSDLAKPRGGTSHGGPVTLAPAQALPLPAISNAASAFERDRAAILALAGDFKVSFHFMEALGFAADYGPQRPYHSWATEHVRVIEDTGRFISLQHTLVMFFQKDDGSVEGPSLVKHWRQDWTYQPAELHEYRGERTWARRRFTPAEAAGAWSQSVWHVDDSPRYAALGRWTHDGNRSVWAGDVTWRPLPRREHSVRSDYAVMEGSHRVVLAPTGWLHEQLNWKRVAGDGAPAGEAPRYVAEEWGLDRYERISAPSLAAADAYWAKTASYWAVVRRVWREEFAKRDRFTLASEAVGESSIGIHFGHAEALAAGAPFDASAAEREVREAIARLLSSETRAERAR
jgi:hypothetical protein